MFDDAKHCHILYLKVFEYVKFARNVCYSVWNNIECVLLFVKCTDESKDEDDNADSSTAAFSIARPHQSSPRPSSGLGGSQLTLANRQCHHQASIISNGTPKPRKKRSRAAFSHAQVFELERRKCHSI